MVNAFVRPLVAGVQTTRDHSWDRSRTHSPKSVENGEIYPRFQRDEAAFCAMRERCPASSLAALALPPARPPLARFGVVGFFASSISPVAIFATMTAAPITSAGRFSPRGPRGMSALFLEFVA